MAKMAGEGLLAHFWVGDPLTLDALAFVIGEPPVLERLATEAGAGGAEVVVARHVDRSPCAHGEAGDEHWCVERVFGDGEEILFDGHTAPVCRWGAARRDV